MWRGMIVGIAFFAAVITPSTDPFTFFAMAIPIWILYGFCILIALGRDRSHRKRAALDPETDLPDDQPSYVDTTPSSL